MDIKQRIDALSESDAKAALLWFLEIIAIMKKKESEYMAGFQNVHPVEYYEMKFLRQALKEVQHGHKETD